MMHGFGGKGGERELEGGKKSLGVGEVSSL